MDYKDLEAVVVLQKKNQIRLFSLTLLFGIKKYFIRENIENTYL